MAAQHNTQQTVLRRSISLSKTSLQWATGCDLPEQPLLVGGATVTSMVLPTLEASVMVGAPGVLQGIKSYL